MFTADATEIASNPAFQVGRRDSKRGGLARGRISPELTGWDLEAPAPRVAKVSAILSFFLWAGVISAGGCSLVSKSTRAKFGSNTGSINSFQRSAPSQRPPLLR
jgi:hypothetical protein